MSTSVDVVGMYLQAAEHSAQICAVPGDRSSPDAGDFAERTWLVGAGSYLGLRDYWPGSVKFDELETERFDLCQNPVHG
jgi:hypothetical protein